MTLPMKSLLRAVALASILAAVAGCDSDGRTRPPQTSVRVFNAAPDYGSVFFLREERAEAQLPFGDGETFRFDSDTYDFSIEVDPAGADRTRPVTSSRTINDENEYNIVVAAVGGALEMLFVPRPRVSGDTGMTIVHAASGESAVDVYFEAPGTDPATSTPLASVAFRDSVIDETLAAGQYELILTAAGDPATVLFRSSTIAYEDQTSALVVVASQANGGLVPLTVFYMEDNALQLNDGSRNAAVRVINGASDTLARDVYLDGDFTAPLVADTAFGAMSAYVPLAPGTRELNVTPAGNPGVEEATGSVVAVAGRRYTTVIGGNPTDGLRATTFIEDHRSLVSTARLQVVNAAHAFATLDFYVLAPNADISLATPAASLGPDGNNIFVSLAPGDYELTVRDRANATNVAGPQPLSLPDGSVQLLLTTDAVGGSTVDVQVFDDTGA